MNIDQVAKTEEVQEGAHVLGTLRHGHILARYLHLAGNHKPREPGILQVILTQDDGGPRLLSAKALPLGPPSSSTLHWRRILPQRLKDTLGHGALDRGPGH